MSARFGDDFGQKVDLTASIRSILRNYPEGTAIFKELIQNADDASARSIRFCMDCRQHRTEKLADPALAQFQGPALLVFNDAVFTKEDFQSIQRIGDSLKNQAEASKTKIGRFGIGFNAVYHWTDLPSFISDHFLVMLDPQARFLPNVNPSNPGKIVDWVKNRSALEEFADQFAPYAIPEVDWARPFAGTLFRLPLRTAAQADASLLSKRSLPVDEIHDVLQSLVAEASNMLLFLRNVESLSIQIWKPDAPAPEDIYSCSIKNVSAALRSQRSFEQALGNDRGKAIAAHAVALQDYGLDVEVVDSRAHIRSLQRWEICSQLGGGQASIIAACPSNSHLKLVPVGGVAINVTAEAVQGAATQNNAYCFLPLPINTGLPVMVNGFFELSSNRRDIWQESVDMTGDGSLRAHWNQSLLEDVLAPCYARLIAALRDRFAFSAFYQRLWPKWDLPQPWRRLGNRALALLGPLPLLRVDSDDNPTCSAKWIEPLLAVVLPTHLSREEQLELSAILRHMGAAVVTFAHDELHRSLVAANICVNIATAKLFRTFLRKSPAAVTHSMCRRALAYCLSDQTPATVSVDLDQLQLLPMKDGSVGKLRVLDASKKQSLDILTSMGHSVQSALGALHKSGFDLERSCDFLAQPTSQVGTSWREDSLFILPANREDLSAFEGAYRIVVDLQALGALEVEVLSCPDAQLSTNIRNFEFGHLPDMLVHMLPPVIFDKQVVALNKLSTAEQQCVVKFLPRLWAFLESNPKALLAFIEGIAILPTTDMDELCPVSRLSNVVCPRKGDVVLPEDLAQLLLAVNVRVLDRVVADRNLAVFPTTLWDYMHPPSCAGLLAALTFARRGSQVKFQQDMSGLSPDHRDSLRAFLAQYLGGDLSADHKDILRHLPLWRLAKESAETAMRRYVSIATCPSAAVVRDCETLPAVLFPEHIVECATPEEWRLLHHINVRALTRAGLYMTFLLPHISALWAQFPTETERMLLDMFLDFRALFAQERSLPGFLKSVPCVLSGTGKLRRVDELFDASETEMLELMGDSLLPHPQFRQEEVTVLLRQLGLRTTIDLPSLLECARAVEQMDDAVQEQLKLAKAKSLLAYLDRNIARLTGEEQAKKPSGLLSSLTALFSDKASTKAEVEQFKTELRRIAWLPVLRAPPLPFLPWCSIDRTRDETLGGAAAGKLCLCAAPEFAAPRTTMWFCSASLRIVDEEISSACLRSALGWDRPPTALTLGAQLRAIALSFQALQEAASASPELEQYRQNVADVIPHFYAEFDQASETDQKALYNVLEAVPWVWMGSEFVPTTKVALQSTVNAAPFLHQLPVGMKCYERLIRTFRIKDHFSARDYVDALRDMAHKSGATPPAKPPTNHTPLSESALDVAISLVVLLGSEASSALRALDIFVPDVTGRLALAADLVNDDVPWLAGQEFLTVRASCRMIHPKISSSVADKLGVKSLRLSLVKKNLEQNLFAASGAAAGGHVESFGQAESLTNRLKTILDLYPDGSPILNELIQNADDSKATVVRIMIDENHYSSESLMDHRMEAMQGPSLVVQNDSQFSEADFRNLASVGQGSKLEKLATTGRFGLGFNSTYHITDTPTFVSGEHFVFFDPHCTHVPGATTNQPGMRIRYVQSDLQLAFADQFAPYRFHGFDFSRPYAGTMFRFPLRAPGQARRSEICKRAYQLADVYGILDQFSKQLSEVLMFLRCVRRIEVYRCAAGSSEPQLLHCATSEVAEVRQANDQQLMSFFDPHAPAQLSKEQFYTKLLNISDDKLPWTTCKKRFVVERYSSTDPDNPASSVLTQQESAEYLIAFGLCGGSAKRLACREEARHLKLIPFGSVAMCVRRSANAAGDAEYSIMPPLQGQLFCFLPLPINTSLPVHMNAYWELSSNRRDIWRGDDTTGEAKLRSDWNVCVMKDVVSVLYARLLVSAVKFASDPSSMCSPAKFMALLPSPVPPQPWHFVAESLFGLVRDIPLVWSKHAGGGYVRPSSAVFLPRASKTVRAGADGSADPSDTSWLEELMLCESLAVVVAPNEMVESFVKAGSCAGVIDPPFVRKHFNALCRPDPSCLCPDSDCGDRHLRRAAKLLQFACSDLGAAEFTQLHGVRLLPLVDGTLGTLAHPLDGAAYFLATDVECRLLACSGRSLVASSEVLGSDLLRIVGLDAFAEMCNVRRLQPIDTLKLLSSDLIPRQWQSAETVGVHRTEALSSEWLVLLWTVLLDKRLVELFAGVFPILPVIASGVEQQRQVDLVKVAPHIPILPSIPTCSNRELVIQGLCGIDVFVLDSQLMAGYLHMEEFSKLTLPFGPRGVLEALVASLKCKAITKASNWSVDIKRAMQAFLLDCVLEVVESLSEDEAAVLRSLPVWNKHGGPSRSDPGLLVTLYENLSDSDMLLPPTDVPLVLLSKRFVELRSERDRLAYAKLGLHPCSRGQFTANHIIPGLSEQRYDEAHLESIRSFVLSSLVVLEVEQPGVSAELAACALFQGQGRASCLPACSLYDPDAPHLRSFLPEFLFPSDAICANPVHLHALKKLGLRREVSCVDVLASARDIQERGDELARSSNQGESLLGLQQVISRSVSLMTYLNGSVEKLLKECDPSGLAVYSGAAIDAVGVEPLVSNDSASSTDECLGGDWSYELRSLSWVAAAVSVPSQWAQRGLPWPSRIHTSPLAAPVQCAVARNIWLASSSMRIFPMEISNPMLLAVLGWSKPVPGRIIALQLLSMSDELAKQATSAVASRVAQCYDEVFPTIFSRLHEAFELESENEKQLWLRVLCGKPVLWMNSGRFAEPFRVAFQSLLSLDTEPFLYTCPQNMHRYKAMLLRLGAKESFASRDLAELTREYFSNLANPQQPLPSDKLAAVVGIVRLLHRLLVQECESGTEDPTSAVREEQRVHELGVVYVPDTHGVLASARCLTYNDAPWIVASLGERIQRIRMVSEHIDVATAKALGAKSLVSMLFAGEDMICPEPELVGAALEKGSVMSALECLMHLADEIGAKTVELLFDQRSFPAESILHPGLASAQGPALVALIDGAIIDHETVTRLLLDPSNTAGAYQSSAGPKLISTFHVTDCLQILSGNEFFVFDPCGEHLVGTAAGPSGGTVADVTAAAAKGKRYRLDRRSATQRDEQDNLVDSFVHQFQPFSSIPLDVCSQLSNSKRMAGVAVRMPLRTKTSAMCSEVLTVEFIQTLFGALKSRVSAVLLFGRSLQKVKLSHMGTADEPYRLDLEVGLVSDPSVRSQRLRLLQTTGWERQGFNKMLSKMFSSAFVPPEIFFSLRLSCKLPVHGWAKLDAPTQLIVDTLVPDARTEVASSAAVAIEESWLIGSTMGQNPLRELALSEVYRAGNLLPFVSIALQVLEPWQLSKHEVPPNGGLVMSGAAVVSETGLPFHIEGPEAGRVRADWTAAVIVTALDTLFPSALMSTAKRLLNEPFASTLDHSKVLEGLYKYWPYLPRLHEVAHAPAQQSAKMRDFFMREALFLNASNLLLSLDKVILNSSAFSVNLLDYLHATTPLARCPPQLAIDLRVLGLPLTELSPGRLRSYLKKDCAQHTQKLDNRLSSTSALRPTMAMLLELWHFVVSDLSHGNDGEFMQRKAFRSLQGCPLLVMADAKMRIVPAVAQNSIAVVGDLAYLQLLPRNALSRLVHPSIAGHVPLFCDPLFLDTLFIAPFGPRFINELLADVFPPRWKGISAIQWAPTTVDNMEQLLYLLWNGTLKSEGLEGLQALRDFAVVPVISNGRRVLLNVSFLPFVLVGPTSATSDARRRVLRDALKEAQHRVLVDAGEPAAPSHAWDWTQRRDVWAVAATQVRESAQGVPPPPHSDEMLTENQPPPAPLDGSVDIAPAADVEADEEEGFSDFSLRTLSILCGAGFPFLDPELLEGTPVAMRYSSRHRERELVGARIVEVAYHFISNHTHFVCEGSSYGLLALEELPVDDRTALLLEIHAAHLATPFTDGLMDKVKVLPLFTNSADMTAVSLLECADRGVFWCQDRSVLDIIRMATNASLTSAEAPSASHPVILIDQRPLIGIYSWLSIVELTAAVAMAKFVVPTIPAMNGVARLRLLQHLASKWSDYREDAPLVAALKEQRFVPLWSVSDPTGTKTPTESWRRISDVLSWTNNELMQSLRGPALPKYFSPPNLQVAGYHVMFTDLGMAQELDGAKLLAIATDIQTDFRATARAPDVATSVRSCSERGRSLIRYLLGKDPTLEAFEISPSLLRQLGQICFVPMREPSAAEEGAHFVLRDSVGAYNQFVAKSNGALAFTVAPILDEDLTPASYIFSHLGIVSHPAEEVILRHLRLLIMCKSLDRWNAPYPITTTFNSIFSALFDRWNGLSTAIKAGLATSALIPIGHSLVAPNRVYFRLAEDLSPFMYELPRHFGAHEVLLKNLHVKETPLAGEYMLFLQELSGEMGDEPLNPNELRAVVTIAQTIVAQLEQQHQWAFLGAHLSTSSVQRLQALSPSAQQQVRRAWQDLFVPDEGSVMRRLSRCVINDNPSLRRKLVQVQQFKYYLLHPWLTTGVGVRLNLLRLSEVVTESLDRGAGRTELLREDADWQARATTLLHGPQVLPVLDHLVQASASRRQVSLEDATVAPELPVPSALISDLRLAFATRLFTSCMLIEPSTTKVLESIDGASRGEILCFLEQAGGSCTLVVNVGKIDGAVVTLEVLLATGLCELLALGKQSVFAVAQVLAHPALFAELGQLLGLTTDAIGGEDCRGAPGRELSALDYSLVELRPFRTFREGEVVAVDDATSMATDGQGRLVYGRVVGVGEPGSSGLLKLDVRTHKGTEKMLATEVRTFRSTRGASSSAAAKPSLRPEAPLLAAAAHHINEGDPSPAPSQSAVGKEDVLAAVQGLLRRAGLPLDLDQQSLVTRVLDLEAAQKLTEDALQIERQHAVQARQKLAADAQKYVCPICMDRSIQRSLVPCGHSFCEGCCAQLPGNRCPFCRVTIQTRLKLFFSEAHP